MAARITQAVTDLTSFLPPCDPGYLADRRPGCVGIASGAPGAQFRAGAGFEEAHTWVFRSQLILFLRTSPTRPHPAKSSVVGSGM